MFEIFIHSHAQRFLAKLDRDACSRIIRAIERLSEDPIPHDSKRVVGSKEKLFRIRVGSFRVLYSVDYEERTVVVIKVDSRERVYH